MIILHLGNTYLPVLPTTNHHLQLNFQITIQLPPRSTHPSSYKLPNPTTTHYTTQPLKSPKSHHNSHYRLSEENSRKTTKRLQNTKKKTRQNQFETNKGIKKKEKY
ncbi:hypothetical protein EX30DRAFT_341741 [Ascodesmis nigricans]|uniref:Uncharacterized protein n=1 Tax=Ascodesmis nigricans TaxID=341454 RepID=A0A4S2MUD3_9PEZI|nr:hypothetical protein EX30DRAFT_341741 [Ascodesmis nigricans]